MGMSYPQYELPQSVLEMVQTIIDDVKKKNFNADKLDQITHRPLRPEEINPALNTETRVYNSTIGKTYGLILGATAPFQVKTGSVYLFLGWIVIEDTTTPLSQDSVCRIKVEGVIRNEICPKLVALQENSALLTLDQIIVATEQTSINIEAKDPSGGGATPAIIFPLAYRIGPKSQLDVS